MFLRLFVFLVCRNGALLEQSVQMSTVDIQARVNNRVEVTYFINQTRRDLILMIIHFRKNDFNVD